MGSPFLSEKEESLHKTSLFLRAMLFVRIRETAAGMSVESIIQQVKAEIAKLNQVLRLLEDGPKQTTVATPTDAPRRKLSASARRRISAAQKVRWAKVRAGKK
jgi:hypothetical protein